MKSQGDPHNEFEKAFSDKHAGYVLITCDQASDSGEMKVKMTYGGSAPLAHLLIDGAHSFLSDCLEESDCQGDMRAEPPLHAPDLKVHKS